MKVKIRIGVVGIGGVGGYFGGKLAQKFEGHDGVEIIFFTKAVAANIIRKHGLTLLTSDAEEFAYPSLVTSNPDEVGILDYLICTVKGYDLEESLLALKNSISENTIFLPLLNGVNAKERIERIYPSASIMEGCVYVVAKLTAPATIQILGNMHSLYFGSATVPIIKQRELASLLKADGIDSYLSPNIEQLLWEKFIFVASLATLTSYLNLPVGAILKNKKHAAFLEQLVSEVTAVAAAKGVVLPNITEITMTKIAALHPDATSSMHNDFIKGSRTEFQTLTEYVVISGLRLRVLTPGFDMVMATYSQWKLAYQLRL